MVNKTYWDENKEKLVNKALTDYEQNRCHSAGFDILRYNQRGVFSIKEEYAEYLDESMKNGNFKLFPYIILRIAKMGGLVWNGS